MAKGFKHGASGGSPLGFRVAGSLTEPSAPREKDIWVETGTAVCGWVFSAEAPESPGEGMVWFTVGTSSAVAFNALKNDVLMVYPLSAKQYIDGAFSSVDAWLYDGASWVQFSLSWDGYYFKDGDQYEDITGGWSSDGWSSGSSSTVVVGDVLSVLSPGSYSVARVGTVDPVDLTGVDTIWFDSPNGKNSCAYSGYLYVCTEKNENTVVAQATISNAGTGSIDVSGLSGPHYLLLRTLGGSGSGYADVRAIWTE